MCVYNPGPSQHPCVKCKKAVRKKNQNGICCDGCNVWFHVKAECVKMTAERYNEYSIDEELIWKCFKCLTKEHLRTTSDDEGNVYEDPDKEYQHERTESRPPQCKWTSRENI